MYGITVNTSIPISADDPYKSGSYSLTYPSLDEVPILSLAEAEAIFEGVVAARRALGDDFVAILQGNGRILRRAGRGEGISVP